MTREIGDNVTFGNNITVVGTMAAAIATVQLGAANDIAKPGGVIISSVTQASISTPGTLATITLPANALGVDTQSAKLIAAGAYSIGAVTLTFSFGGTTIVVDYVPNAPGNWMAELYVMRLTSSTVRMFGRLCYDTAAYVSVTRLGRVASSSKTLSSAQNFTVAMTSAGGGETVTMDWYKLMWDSNNT